MNKTITGVINSIKKAKPLMYVASVAEDFVKVWAEYKYDALAETNYFQKLKNLGKEEKLVIVAAMFALNAHLKMQMTDDTPLNLFLKGILTDFFPEIGKRLINGTNSPDSDEQEVIEFIRKTDSLDKSTLAKIAKGLNVMAERAAGYIDGIADKIPDRCNADINPGFWRWAFRSHPILASVLFLTVLDI